MVMVVVYQVVINQCRMIKSKVRLIGLNNGSTSFPSLIAMALEISLFAVEPVEDGTGVSVSVGAGMEVSVGDSVGDSVGSGVNVMVGVFPRVGLGV
ncbi:hypothetical protein FDZ73_23100 [bacterium]|nr:MAG: hypothetical protein FDZ73_23100 [bacterium]